MDVYVLTEDGVPLGAGTDRSVCEDIADRRGETDWTKWVDQSGGGWARSRRAHWSWSLTQRIVRLPLAGADRALWSDSGHDIAGDLKAAVRDIAEANGLRFVTERTEVPPALDVTRMAEVIREMQDRTRERIEVRVGGGPAWEWLKGGLDRLTFYPSGAAMPDSRATAMIWGAPVIRDPDLRDDMISMGDVRFIVGREGNPLVPAGQVLRVDVSRLGYDPFA